MTQSEPVTIVECPRDAWQALPRVIPAEVKAGHLRRLIAAGFRHIDAVSFVSRSVVPQMADSERVLELLGPAEGVEIIGIVANLKGAERALQTGAVKTLGFPYSVSATFLERNQRQTLEQAWGVLSEVCGLAREHGLGVVAYVSMAFGNPYGDGWSAELVNEACARLAELEVRQISLSDTVGLAYSALVAELVGAVRVPDGVEVGVHLHATRADAAEKVRAAYGAGCRRFDAALGGLGGCPFAQDALVGNLPTEVLVETLRELGAELPGIHLGDELLRENGEIGREYGHVEVTA